MSRQRKSQGSLDYESAVLATERIHFGLGGLSLALALTAAAVTMGVFLVPSRIGLSAPMMNLIFETSMLMNAIGLICGGTGLFGSRGKLAAIFGIALSLMNLLFIPGLMFI